MTTIREVRESIARCVSLVVRCSPYVIDQVNAPCAMVDRLGMDPRTVFSGSRNVYRFAVVVFAPRVAEIHGQQLLDSYAETDGEASVKTVIENGDNWTTDVDYASVTQIGGTDEREIGGVAYLTVTFDVEVGW